MTSSVHGKKVIIVGAGLSGALMSIYLARRGYEVEILERRSDTRRHDVTGGRSINMTLAARGLEALKNVLDIDQILELTIPLKGRMVHSYGGLTKFIPYGSRSDEVIYAIRRKDLNQALLNVAETYPNVSMYFEERCLEMDKQNKRLHLVNEKTGAHHFREADFIIGADGTFSTIRQQMHRGERANYQQEFLDCGYKEITLPPGKNNSWQLEKHALHVWPRGGCMLMGIPNPDGSFALTYIMPFSGRPAFNAFTTDAEMLAYFHAQFADVVPLIGPFLGEYLKAQPAMFPTTKVSPWHYRGNILLIGDACHTVTPFYGQGMNAAFEDCAVLDECLSENGEDLEATFEQFQQRRKRHTDVLADLSIQNFLELRDKVRSPVLLARKKMDSVLHKLLRDSWLPLYTLISHTTIPYGDALDRYERQCRRGRLLGLDIALATMAGCIYGDQMIRSWLGHDKHSADETDVAALQQLNTNGDDRPGVVEDINRHAHPQPVNELKSAAGMRHK